MRHDADVVTVQVHQRDGWQDYFVGQAEPGRCRSILDTASRTALHYSPEDLGSLALAGRPASVPAHLWQRLIQWAQREGY